ncbi:MAG: helix-turn-helix transcriptional regulator [Parasporobacterium sp.]|nr:helix-turn-helix transcriptional regulator [Parasporobacterium sp.]MBR3361195.1 helix-turn-helix transcriptional regulator [Lachnospiraceae bacterium]MBR3643011.1 helix-turn-helix transcriptional regulator [Parasporobacterium sp.]
MNAVSVGIKLKHLRGKRTQQEISDALGLKQSTYAMYESGKRIPSDENKIKIAKYHGKTVQELFYD